MVSLDPPAHTRLRRPASSAFTPRRVAAMEDAHPCDRRRAARRGRRLAPFDLVSALTFPLPATIVFSFMGVPEEDWAQLKTWCGSRATLAWGRPAPDEQVEHARNMAAYRGYLRALVKGKVDDRADDYASALLAIHDEDPEALSHEEIASILFSLSFAGHETTNYLIGNLIRRLLEERSRWEAVVADRELIPGAVDETLRFDTSVPVWRRITTKPTDARRRRPAGGREALPLARRERPRQRRLPRPRPLRPRARDAHHNLAFGKGIHYCAGATLGKLEARLAMGGLIERWPELRLVEDQTIPFHPNISFRGPLELWATAELARTPDSDRAAAGFSIDHESTARIPPFESVAGIPPTASEGGRS